MTDLFTIIGVILLAMIFLVLIRLVSGPSIVDRVMATNIIGTKTVILLLIIGLIYQRVDMFVDLALTYALLNFIGSLAAARFIKRRRDDYQYSLSEEADPEGGKQ